MGTVRGRIVRERERHREKGDSKGEHSKRDTKRHTERGQRDTETYTHSERAQEVSLVFRNPPMTGPQRSELDCLRAI